jgi:hypothetical protein
VSAAMLAAARRSAEAATKVCVLLIIIKSLQNE